MRRIFKVSPFTLLLLFFYMVASGDFDGAASSGNRCTNYFRVVFHPVNFPLV